VSKVYETPSWGFESDAFITAHWYIPFIQLKKVLTLALKLEKKLGRVRNSEIGYQSRIIDIDVIALMKKLSLR
jgi:2-amino-4-hydroxy-6-hydroxymethyldihydropteridine diphosphokinase